MFGKKFATFVLFAILSSGTHARMRVIERDGRALYGRRFGQENPSVIRELGSACAGQICGVLSGKAIGTLLAASPECAQQDLADDIIAFLSDAARQQDATTAAKMIEIAKTFRQAEKNTPPDFTTNPPTNRNSVFCQTPPRNSELVGLNQAQDPNNNPDDFFDPACKCTVKKGSQANTAPLSGSATSGGSTSGGGASSVVETAAATATEEGITNTASATKSDAATATESVISETATATISETASVTTTDTAATATVTSDGGVNTCPPASTVTVTVDPAASTATDVATSTSAAAEVTETASASVTITEPAGATGTTSATTDSAVPAVTGTPSNGNIDLGSCTDPTIRFGAGIEGRKETSFIPNNTKEFTHGSAQNSAIITQFICDASITRQAAIDTCAQAKAAAAAAGAKKGAAADAFNALFGVTTKFASIQALDDQGRPVA
ncbi:hypothetical protein CTheo_4836 [Ceratobasidium theobromae]|uniref:Uncharacterized protein n=1 Tax=Ceratobasidium theobromae TaxID=1582974 RepID=A0A5N5QJ02_9AGAM|nr:hypothetical protein CTheo_4836 [Ceratobasidium theobromae]